MFSKHNNISPEGLDILIPLVTQLKGTTTMDVIKQQKERIPSMGPMIGIIPNTTITIDYTNYKGERAKRKIMVRDITWGTTEWHPEPGFLLHAVDLRRNELRSFSMKMIHNIL